MIRSAFAIPIIVVRNKYTLKESPRFSVFRINTFYLCLIIRTRRRIYLTRAHFTTTRDVLLIILNTSWNTENTIPHKIIFIPAHNAIYYFTSRKRRYVIICTAFFYLIHRKQVIINIAFLYEYSILLLSSLIYNLVCDIFLQKTITPRQNLSTISVLKLIFNNTLPYHRPSN